MPALNEFSGSAHFRASRLYNGKTSASERAMVICQGARGIATLCPINLFGNYVLRLFLGPALWSPFLKDTPQNFVRQLMSPFQWDVVFFFFFFPS